MKFFVIICLVTGLGCATFKPVTMTRSFSIKIKQTTSKTSLTLKKGDELDLYYKNEYVGSMKWSDYELIQEAAKEHLKELTAEQKKRVKITLSDSPWKIEIGQKYTTDAFLIWCDENDKEFKKIKIQLTLERKDTNSFTCEQVRILAGVLGGVAGAALIVLIITLILLL